MQRARISILHGGGMRQAHQAPGTKRNHDQGIDKEKYHVGYDAQINCPRQATNQSEHREEKEQSRSCGTLGHITCQQIEEDLLAHLRERLRYSKKGQSTMGAKAASRRERPRHKGRSHIGHSFEGQQGHEHREVRKALALRHAPGHTAEKGGADKEAEEKHVVKIDIKPHELVLPFCRNGTHDS